MKYTKHYLSKLEDIFAESDYILRYEKGSFKSGYCILKSQQVIVVNKYFTTEGRINCLIDILRSLDFSGHKLSERSQRLFLELTKPEKIK